MKILIEAHHPAHIHFWKFPIRELQRRGHEVLLIGRDRDVMNQLLEAYDWITAIVPQRRSTRNRLPLLEMVQRQWLVMKTIARFKPDVVASLMGSYTQSAKLFGIRNIIFTDTETQNFNHRIAHPFADEIHTPYCFYKELGKKQKKYKGLHELSFLHPNYFEHDFEVLYRCGGLVSKKYILIRMSAWNTFHDRGRHGIGDSIFQFVEKFKHQYRIVISAEEGRMPPGLEAMEIQCEPEEFHQILCNAVFVLTEGASTASEAACLGVPSVFINSVGRLGNFDLLDKKFGLIRAFSDSNKGIPYATNCLESIARDSDATFVKCHEKFLESMIDVCDYVVEVLESLGD